MRRALCLLLTILILASALPTTVFASGSFGAGSGHSSGGVGGGKDTIWTPDPYSAGILVNVQTTPTTISGPADENGNPKGYTDTLKYWCTHFPENRPEKGISGIYLIPYGASKRLSGKQPAAIQWFGQGNHSNVYLNYHGAYMQRNDAGDNLVPNHLGRDAYTVAASSRTNESNPSYSLPSNYWQTKIEKLRNAKGEEEGCFNIIANLFSPVDVTNGIIKTEGVAQINNQIKYYLGQIDGSANSPVVALGINANDKEALKVANFMYYCGFIATAITALPDKAARTPLSKDLDNMCQNYFNGQPYNPMVVTGEVLIGSEYCGSVQWSDVWWTPSQAIRAVTKNDDPLTDISGYIAKYPNLKPIDAIGAHFSKGYGTAPARTMFGLNYPGQGFKKCDNLPERGRVIQSIDPSYLTGLGVKPIEGFGVWGVTSASLTVPELPKPPTSSAQLTPMGEVGIDVMEKVYVEDSLSFTETLDLTVKVSLDGSYVETEGDTVVDEGAGIAPCLGWLKEHDTTRSYMPKITVFIKQAEPITALDSTKADELIQRTWGYFGSGLIPNPNDNGEIVTPEPDEENRAGASFTWTQPDLSNLVFQDGGISGMTCTVNGTELIIQVTDYDAAIEYFNTHDATLVFKGPTVANGNLDNENDSKQIWFKDLSFINHALSSSALIPDTVLSEDYPYQAVSNYHKSFSNTACIVWYSLIHMLQGA